MGLTLLINTILRKKEMINGVLMPKELIARGLTPADAPEFFNPYFVYIDDAVKEAYETEFKVGTDASNPRKITHTLTSDDVTITYHANIGVGNSEDDNQPGIYTGFLNIQQKVINLEKAGKFINKLLDNYLLWSLDPEGTSVAAFDIYTHSKGKSAILDKGKPLLEKMGVKPTEACRYLVHPYGGCVGWTFLDFSKSGVGQR